MDVSAEDLLKLRSLLVRDRGNDDTLKALLEDADHFLQTVAKDRKAATQKPPRDAGPDYFRDTADSLEAMDSLEERVRRFKAFVQDVLQERRRRRQENRARG